ncbi:sigma-B regulation protein RsbU (phosphoserine phosphatase) [Cetobacterium ceti]|uniref:Sigma-B regulation protein RsbU (Phosphoserine phosphatase) n=1 Tax=Cetobacterium ceti TaxID=180163 RepID=A0A1T4KSZ8_9FUSO|nr:PP2C family protein-serine/threonine phosphatase [Cetobacterium ceti]SJZ45559.1 sigma-B regulation protein RsbU (phosphoserine phosphatase) [Cetobacterium ceti]
MNYIVYVGMCVIFFLVLKKQEKENIKEISKILRSLREKEIYDDVPDIVKDEYKETITDIIKQEMELENSIGELREYRRELEVTYNSLVSKSTQLEYSNQALERRVASLSNINALSRTVLSIMELEKIINIILDAYFVLTGAKRISLYLWEDGRLLNKRIKGDIDFRGELYYSPEILKKFTKQDYKRVYDELAKGFKIDSDETVIVSPLVVKGKELGVIFIIEDNAKLINSDEETVSALAIQVAIAINNAQIYSDLLIKERISKELEVAARIQKRILPKNIDQIMGLEVANYFQPAKEIGGDYYDYSLLEDGTFTITIADVSGKGVPAAFLMALGRAVLKTLELQGKDPEENLNHLNNIIYPDITEDMFITMLHTKYNFDTRKLTYSNAGHNPLIVYKAKTDEIELHSVKGVAIGFLKGYKYRQGELELDRGDIVVYYTDGITETENLNKELFGLERLKDVIYANKNKNAEEIKKEILEKIDEFKGENEQVDDLTFVILKNNE